MTATSALIVILQCLRDRLERVYRKAENISIRWEISDWMCMDDRVRC